MKRFVHIWCYLLPLVLSLALLPSCKDSIVSDDPTLRLTLSRDTLSFDTGFTGIGSATEQIMIRNYNKNAIRISKIWIEDGRYFHVNIDGETEFDKLQGFELRGGDSLYVFVQVNIDPSDQDNPFLIQDAVHIAYNDHVQDLTLMAHGQDVVLVRSKERLSQFETLSLTAERPYLVYDTVLVSGALTMEAGTRVYMHSGASIYAYGDVQINGTLTLPVTVQGDRLDNLFDSVPYSYAAGAWGGIYLVNSKKAELPTYHINYAEIRGGNVGLYCISERSKQLPSLVLHNSVIHNHALYGLVLENINAEVVNTEISNTASYCVYINGGTQRFVHTTIASYFRWTNVNIQSTYRDSVSAVYIDNLSKTGPQTRTSFINSVITGVGRNNLRLATPLAQYYGGEFIGCYIKADSLITASAHDNVYWHSTDTANVFVNDFYEYKKWQYYDFRLDSLSPARGIAIPDTATNYPLDRLGYNRLEDSHADAGCYEYVQP